MQLLRCASLIAVVMGATVVFAQQDGSPLPYDSIGSKGVSYDGPGRNASFDLEGPIIHIGLLAPVHGPQKADGEAIVRAAQMALRDASKRPLPGGLHFALDVADESVPPWGLLGDEIIHLVLQQRVIAIVTCADGVAAHLSEQIGNKVGVSTLTLSTDPTTTQINMPWIFRLAPSDAQQAEVISRDIYRVRGFQRVLLVTGPDHDGRVGGREFTKAVHRLEGSTPLPLLVERMQTDTRPLLARIRAKSPQAIVLWTQPEDTKKLLEAFRADGVRAQVYLSQESAQESAGLRFHGLDAAGEKDRAGDGIYTVVARQTETASFTDFANRYHAAAGAFPSPAAAEAYDAVRLIVQAVRQAGPNRARVRDQVAATRDHAGASGIITFDEQGNNLTNNRIVRLQ